MWRSKTKKLGFLGVMTQAIMLTFGSVFLSGERRLNTTYWRNHGVVPE
jgi:hypothetical protein